jgi:hypothetical protein
VQRPDFDLSDPDAVFFCPSCGAGYTATALRCSDCDQELVPRSWIEQQAQGGKGEGDDVDETTLLCRIAGPIKAGRLEAELAEAGIRFFTGTHGVLGLGHDGMHGTIDFFVLKEDLRAAEGIVRRVEELEEHEGTEPEDL